MVSNLESLIVRQAPVLCSAWAGDGARAYYAGCSPSARMWDLASNTVAQIGKHDDCIRHIFSLPTVSIYLSIAIEQPLDQSIEHLLTPSRSFVRSFYCADADDSHGQLGQVGAVLGHSGAVDDASRRRGRR